MKKTLMIALAAAAIAVTGCDKLSKTASADATTDTQDSTKVTQEQAKGDTEKPEQNNLIGLWTLNNDKTGPDSTRNQINFGDDGNGYYKIGSQKLDFKWIGKGDKIYLTTEGKSTRVYNILAHDARSLVIQEDGSDNNRINHFVR